MSFSEKPIDESALREAITPTSIDPDATLDAIRKLWPKPVLPSVPMGRCEGLREFLRAHCAEPPKPLAVPREVVEEAIMDAGKPARALMPQDGRQIRGERRIYTVNVRRAADAFMAALAEYHRGEEG